MTEHWSDSQIAAAEARARALLDSEQRATAVRYDARADRVVVELSNGATYSFPPRLAQDLAGADAAQLAEVEIAGAGFGLRWPSLDADLDPRPARGPLRHQNLDERTRPSRGQRQLPRQGRRGTGERGEGREAKEGGLRVMAN